MTMPSLPSASPDAIETFIKRWTTREGGAERANYQMFLSELCDILGVARPEPSGNERDHNDYVFERAVRPRGTEGTSAPKRIDLYKKGAFILEAKQSRLPGKKNAIAGQLSLLGQEPEQLGKRSIARGWDVMMQNARKQAENYVFLLDANHPAPPFIIVCDVGHCFEIYADFTGTGRAYNQFPDRNGFRIYLEDLRDEAIRTRLATIWTDPHSLDPSKKSARVTRDIAKRLAQVSKALEERGCNPEDVAHFLMRCLFTMFAEDVELLPRESFKGLLEKSVKDASHFPHRLKALWQQMEKGEEFSHVIEARVRHFNGGLFRDTTVFPLGREEIGELLAAASHSWTEVDPAIFGTLLEQALDKTERKKLGAHYTPRAYVQRLVEATVMEPLRADWEAALTKAERAQLDGEEKKAVALVRAFHHQLCGTRVLDPACGTGNFLYVSLELMKKLEGEVLETLAKLGEPESMGLDRETVDPHQFLGLELNPRAAAIAELVVWIGYLQQHYRTRTGHPSEPILRAFENINFGKREGYDAVLTWDGYPVPKVVEKDGRPMATYPNARRPVWPEAEFIVGNPPFIGGKDLRARLGDAYTATLWAVHKHMNDSADFVMYWWDRAAEFLVAKKTPLRRFGFVTTNSITQEFSRRVIKKRMDGKPPVSLLMAIPDHPWTKAAADAAAVRIAMTVAVKGECDGVLHEVVRESGLDTDEPVVELIAREGRVNADLTVGVDVASVVSLLANEGLCSRGVSLHGAGFIVTPEEAQHLGLGRRPGLEHHIRPYRNGRDLTAAPRGVMVIDLFGLETDEIRQLYPEVYQHVLGSVKPERDTNNRDSYRLNWWIFGEPRRELRPALTGLNCYVATVETAKHRAFQFLDAIILPDNKLIAIAIKDAFILGVLSSRLHVAWSLRAGGWLGIGNDSVYVKSKVFDPFPFPDPPEALKEKIRAVAEELDAFRKTRQAEHPRLTLTQMYNVLEKLKAVEAASRAASWPGSSRPSTSSEPRRSKDVDLRHKAGDDGGKVMLTPEEERIKEEGLILILKELHERLDALVFEAYGWPAGLSDEEILERLVALNAERAKEEAAGHVRWLRPDYQIPRFAKGATAKSGELNLGENVVAIDRALPDFPKDPYEQPLAVESLLLAANRPMDAAELARAFKRGGKRIEQRITQCLSGLALYGRITPLDDGRYAARRAA
ncbi:class I SAM-dependent DNA methyltransferase [Microvirga puerhi]|uniref:site-specific DNA-methyltransferase (adenine-specific) n=1 Tax=Microvirga puerhi TaxID=2876078 RepID=A0ABS7VRJ0_9HYPH|nr:DNA methyltransferase [Microvirga puerhi]MBZ6078155.1 class I SAM-dependent DNA methyltransferase [Microvirga puerhi]